MSTGTNKLITFSLILLAISVISMLAAACQPGSKTPAATTQENATSSPTQIAPPTPTTAPQGILSLYGADPATLDPATSADSTSHDYVVQIFSGLVRLGDDLRPAPDIAASWDISSDGKTYTFHLRNDVKFHDGRQVKSADFKYSWERAASPATRSLTALTYLGDIVGVKEVVSGQASAISGVSAPDDFTLTVTIESPNCYFLSKLTYTPAFVVDRNNVKSAAEWWQKANGTGPFKLRKWEEGKQLALDRNDSFYGDKALVKSVVFSIQAGLPMSLYETGKIDAVGVSLSYIERASDPAGPFAGQLTESPLLSFSYIGFNSKKPPFDDPNIRLAFSYAVDKDKLVNVAFKNMVGRADGVLPPGMPGYNPGIAGIPFDVARAKTLVASSRYGSVANLPPIVFTTAGEGGAVSGYIEAIAYQWKQNLGVDVTIRALETDRYLYNLSAELDNLYDLSWIADYPHPQDFLDVLFHSGADMNYGGYANPAYDALVDQANRQWDFNLAAPLYQKAEQLLVNDAAVLPLFFSENYTLVKPYVKGYDPNALGFVMLNEVSVQPH